MKLRELISKNSGSCVLELREFHFLYSFSPKNNSGSCTEGAPGVALGGGMVILFMEVMKDLCAKEDETVTTEEGYLDALSLRTKKNPMMKNLSAECNPCISHFGGMWERFDKSRVGLQEVNVTNRESTKRGHTCQRTLAKDVQLSK